MATRRSRSSPREVPLRENVALLATLLLRHTSRGAETQHAASVLRRYVKTATDVLRLAVALSDGDVRLAAATKFRRFSRPERRLLLELLEENVERASAERRTSYPSAVDSR